MNVLFVTQTTELGPASRYRVHQFLPALQQAGVHCEVSPAIGDGEYTGYFEGSKLAKMRYLPVIYSRRRRDVNRFKEFDVIYIQKQFFPLDWPHWSFPRRLVYDIDDAVFGPATERLLRASALVFAGNEFLAEYARRFARNVMVIPTVVDTERFRPVSARAAQDGGALGWIGSRTTTIKYLEMLRPLFVEPSGYRVKVVSSHLPGFPCKFVRWSLESEVEQMQSMDIGLAPLADTPWERGKCGLKTLQYMACGIPVIASPVGVQRMLIERSGAGLLAASLEEWDEKIHWLIEHPDERRAMGARGRKFVEENYSLRTWSPHWVEAIVTLAREARK